MTQVEDSHTRRMHSSRGLGAYTAERREALGLTQQELADRVGVSRSWVARFERDSSSAVLYRIMDTLKVLGVTMMMVAEAVDTAANEGREDD